MTPRPDPETGVVEGGDGVHLLPTLHQSVEFAVLVRRAFLALRPDVVALELPRTVDEAFRKAVLRLPLLSVVLYPEGDEAVYLPVEPHEPMVEAARLALENGAALELVDRDDGSVPLRRERTPDAWALTRTGAGPFVQELLRAFPPSGDARDLLRERTMAFRLRRLAEGGRRVLWVGGAAHARGILRALGEPLAEPIGRVRREGVRLASLATENLAEVMSEIPWVSASFERARSGGRALAFDAETDSQRALDALLREAARAYEEDQRERVPRRAFEVMRRFSRNLALVQGVLTPGFYELIVAARGAADDDFAWHVFDRGSSWPWPDETRALPEVRLTGEDLFLDGRKVGFKRRFPNKGARLKRLPVKPRPKERTPGEWSKHRFGSGICSYPPEDVAIEGYGNRLRARAVRSLSEETRRVVPFTTSLLDGLDLKETLRRFTEHRLWVFEERKVRGGVGSVVVVFDEDEDRYPWRVTWLGEHGQESDMAFYATRPEGHPVGPGIGRCEYGGFLMTMPPGRLADVWSDPDYRPLTRPSEVLLVAALDYALEPRVVYVARKPPRAALRRFASRVGKRIVFLPFGSVSSSSLHRLRKFHVLSNRFVRTYARDFIPT